MEQFGRRPLVIGQACGNGWSALHPMVAERTNGQFQTQAFVKVAEVVKAANQIHACDQSLRLLRQIAGTTCQGADPLAKGGVETFNERGIDHAFALCRLEEAFHPVFRTLHNPSVDMEDAFYALFDNLHNRDVLPSHHPASSRFALATRELAPKRVPKGADITGQPVHRQQKWTTQGHLLHLVCQRLNQIQIAFGTDYPADPQTRLNPNRQRHPERSFLSLDFDFIGLRLLQIMHRVFNQMFMHLLTMLDTVGEFAGQFRAGKSAG